MKPWMAIVAMMTALGSTVTASAERPGHGAHAVRAEHHGDRHKHRGPHHPGCGHDDGDDDGDNDGGAVRQSCCGFPGDRGNELGVGKFCKTDEQCKHNAGATLCSSIENDLTDHATFFCTIPCQEGDGEEVCGTGARCNCEEVGCGCTPVACIEHPPAQCEGP